MLYVLKVICCISVDKAKSAAGNSEDVAKEKECFLHLKMSLGRRQ